MSAKMTGIVWDSDLPRYKKYILLAYADHANHDGEDIFPAVPTIAWKTGYSERQVQRVVAELMNDKIMAEMGVSYLGTKIYKINVGNLPQREVRANKRRGRPKENGVIVSPILEENGDILEENGDIAMSLDPSFKPSFNPPGSIDSKAVKSWADTLAALKFEIPEPNYSRYLKSLTLVDYRNGNDRAVFVLAAEDEDKRAWAADRLRRFIQNTLAGAHGLAGIDLEFVAQPAQPD